MARWAEAFAARGQADATAQASLSVESAVVATRVEIRCAAIGRKKIGTVSRPEAVWIQLAGATIAVEIGDASRVEVRSPTCVGVARRPAIAIGAAASVSRLLGLPGPRAITGRTGIRFRVRPFFGALAAGRFKTAACV